MGAVVLHVELDGLGHFLVSQWVAATERSNELEISKHGRRLAARCLRCWPEARAAARHS